LDSLIWYAYDRQGQKRGSYRLSAIRRPAQLWLIGDVGVPKPNVEDLEKYPYGGYYRTDISTFPPDALGIWDSRPSAKQPGFRHSLRANVTYADGHVESKDYRSLSSNENDIFGLKSK
jgi:prepilin-type processing-associated H-X9-DG protein